MTQGRDPMSPEQWITISTVLADVLELPTAARARFIADTCGGDMQLQQEIESLVEAAGPDGSDDGILDNPVIDLHAPAAKNGELVGHYRIRRLLGRGGMGEVYLADDIRLGRAVALKLVSASVDPVGPEARQLGHEARAASVLSHPNICVVHDVGTKSDGLPFIAMEYVDGQSIRALLDQAMRGESRIPLPDIVSIIRQAADGLAAAHAVGVLHKDVKPENLLVRPDRLVKVVDFGIATRTVAQTDRGLGEPSPLASRKPVDLTGAKWEPIRGTLQYMSPEQLRGLPLDERADIWSLGAVLYEMLSQKPAFSGGSYADLVAGVLKLDPPSLATLTPPPPPALVALVNRMLAKDREERPRKMEEVAAALQNIHIDLAPAAQSHVPPNAVSWMARRTVTVLGVGSALGLAALTVVPTVRQRLFSPPPLAKTLSPPLPIDPKRVLVTAFEHAQGDSTLTITGRLAADWVLLGLQSVPGLRVIDPGTALLSERAERQANATDSLRNPSIETTALNARIAGGSSFRVARSVGAAIVVWGRVDRTGDSLVFVVRVSNVATGVQQAMVRLAAPQSQQVALFQQLRQRIGGAVAGLTDEGTVTLVDASTAPPSLEAYQAYANGLPHFADRRYAVAVRYFEQAIALDSAFMLPRIWAMFAYRSLRQLGKRDTMMVDLATRRRLLTPLELAALEYFEAEQRGDERDQLRAVRRAALMAPGSNWTYMEGMLERRAGRPRVALDRLNGIDPTRGWVRGWPAYWGERLLAWHELGDHTQELKDARRARSINGEDIELRGYEAKALAATGQVKELRWLLDSIRVEPWTPDLVGMSAIGSYVEAAIELRAHGYEAQGSALLNEVVTWPWSKGVSAAERTEILWQRARALQELGSVNAADSALRAIMAAQPQRVDAPVKLALLHAATKNRLKAEQAFARAELLLTNEPRATTSLLFTRGIILGMLGDKAEATRLIQRAFARGYQGRYLLHRYLPLREAMRGYEPFNQLLAPRP